MRSGMKKLVAVGALALAGLATAIPSHAATVTYTTARTGILENVDDAEGRWQFSGGNVFIGRTHVGYFIRKKRVSFAPAVNKSSVETTIIWKWGSHALTVQGTHNFSDGSQVGGVSAASAGFSAYKDGTFTGTHQTMTITY